MISEMSKDYTADSIRVLKGLEAVRTRPGMYIGNTDELSGLHHMVYEVVDNSIDEAIAGYCKHIQVVLHKDGSVSVEDDGRGMPIDMHKEEGIPAAEVIMTQLHAGAKFSQDTYKISAGLHGVGVSVVNALSQKLTLRVFKDGTEYEMDFKEGKTITQLHEIGKTTKHGTYVQFLPDPTIFSKIVFDYDVLANRFQELAFLNPGVSIKITDRRTGDVSKNFASKDGIEGFARHICGKKETLNSIPLLISGTQNDVQVDCAIFWTKAHTENSLFFTNTIPQPDGGSHVAGLRSALTKSFQSFVREKGTKAQQKVEFSGDDIREGMVCVLSVRVPDPQFSSQTKEKLTSSNVRQPVESLVSKATESWLEENPDESGKIIQSILEAAAAREAARKARELSRKKSNSEYNLQVSKKLAGCSEKDPSKCELFIVEGNSAGGSAKQGRNRFFQAVLPLRGKILNIEKANFARAISSEVIGTMIAAIGTGIGEEFDINRLKYNKIIIMTDADVDGKHIRVLLMTFFFRYMRQLIENGHIYISIPPLYGVVQKNNVDYLDNEEEYTKYMLKRGIRDVVLTNPEGKELLDEKQLWTYLNSIYNVKNKFQRLPYIYESAIAAKIFTEGGDANHLQTIADYMSQKHLGAWTVEKDKIVSRHNGIEQLYTFDFASINNSARYTAESFTNSWQQMWGQNVFWNGEAVKDPFGLLEKIIAKGKKGLYVQRYKGLGEMNPEQLRVTGLKKFYKLTMKDAELADKFIVDLMGDDVDARKVFISENATYAEPDV